MGLGFDVDDVEVFEEVVEDDVTTGFSVTVVVVTSGLVSVVTVVAMHIFVVSYMNKALRNDKSINDDRRRQ